MAEGLITVQTALVSVNNKNSLPSFIEGVKKVNPALELLASGGTGTLLESHKIPCLSIEEYTGFAECFGGRVKTLHPFVMGGILYRRGIDEQEANQLGIKRIDLVVCNLYDFAKAAADRNKPASELVEQIDIGGSSLIRSAAKNYMHVAVVVDPEDYPLVLQDLERHGGKLSLDLRKYLAAKAFQLSASYEALLAQEMASRLTQDKVLPIPFSSKKQLRYGENPDQKAWLYELPYEQGIAKARLLSGKELSYNNYEDATVAYEAAQDLSMLSASHGIAIVKHGNLCCLATAESSSYAFQKAWEGDSKSAFGSVIASLSPLGSDLIPLLQKKFIEVVIAPAFDEEFVAWARTNKPQMRLLQLENGMQRELSFKSIGGGILAQTKKERKKAFHWECWNTLCEGNTLPKVGIVTKRKPLAEQLPLYQFGVIALNFAKSNAVAIVREVAPGSYQLLGMGAGQPNRIDSLERLAIPKAIENLQAENRHIADYHPQADLQRCVLASDGFFPFPDSVQAAAKYGIQNCIQPGGSLNDEAVIDAANSHDLCMIFTGERYFSH